MAVCSVGLNVFQRFGFHRITERFNQQSGTGKIGGMPDPLVLTGIRRQIPSGKWDVDAPSISVKAMHRLISKMSTIRYSDFIRPVLYIQRQVKSVFLHIPVVYGFFVCIMVPHKVNTISYTGISEYRVSVVRIPKSHRDVIPLSCEIEPAVISILSPHRNDFFCGDVQFDQVFILPAFQNPFRCKPCKLAFLFQTKQFGIYDIGSLRLT